MNASLPEGWTLARVREVSQSATVEVLSTTVPVVMHPYRHGNDVEAEPERLTPEVILSFGGLVLVKPRDEHDWYMGQVHGTEIVCWASYGPDLEEAIRALQVPADTRRRGAMPPDQQSPRASG